MERKIFYFIIISIITIFFLPINALAGQNTEPEKIQTKFNENYGDLPKVENLEQGGDVGVLFATKKDPFLAGFYSFFMMGAGHFYTGEYQKGTLFLFSDLMLKAVLVGMLLHFKSEYTTDTHDYYRWRDLDVKDRSFIIGYSIVYLVILVLNITDAIQSAHKYNRRYIRNKPVSLNLNLLGDKQFGLALSTNF